MERHDFIILAKVFVYSFIIFKIVFYNEPFTSVIRSVAAFSIMTYIPGYLLTKKIIEHNEQRLLFGSMITLTILGVASYYLGLIGIPLHITAFALPTLLITIGLIITRKQQ